MNRARWLLPCLISVALHAAILVPLTLIPTPTRLLPGQPLALEAIVLEDDLRLSLEPPREPVIKIDLLPPTASVAKPAAPVVELPPSHLAPSGPIRPVGHAEAVSRPGTGSADGSGEGTTSAGGSPALFSSPTRARSVVYVIDRSISMGLNGALEQVKRELLTSLARLPADVRFQIVFYNRSAQPLLLGGAVGMALPTPANREAVARQLAALSAEGATDHLPALALALSYDVDMIYFLTDADDLRPEQVQQVTRMNRGRAVIHTIELTTANTHRVDMPLQALARHNRGTYRAIPIGK